MKKILLGLIMLATAATMNAQIELEHVFPGIIYPETYSYSSVHRYYGMEDYYVVFDYNVECTKIYDKDFGYVCTADAYPYIIAKNIFTTNNEICYLTTRGENLKICNQDGVVLNEFAGDSENPPFLKQIGNEYKLVMLSWNAAAKAYETYIYSCPGNGETTTSVENVPAKAKRNAYPNPASDLVILPYDANGATSMKIYDMQGKLVERKFLDKSKQELQLNVKDYPSGMYFFEVNGESNSFIVD